MVCMWATIDKQEADEQNVINMMVGRELDRSLRSVPENISDVLLKVKGLSNKSFSDVSFSMKKGEILGFSGLVGAGRQRGDASHFWGGQV